MPDLFNVWLRSEPVVILKNVDLSKLSVIVYPQINIYEFKIKCTALFGILDSKKLNDISYPIGKIKNILES